MRTRTFPARIQFRTDPPEPDPDEVDPEADPVEEPEEPAEPPEPVAEGQFEALVSVFGVKDAYGEVVMPGAFTRTLSEWEQRGDPIPVYWSHRLDDPDFNIGHVLEAKETDEGLYVKAQLDLDNPKAVTTQNLLTSRRVTQFSFSFNVPPGGMREGQDATELTDIELYEVGPTPIGANPATELIGAKDQEMLTERQWRGMTALTGTASGIAYDFSGVLGGVVGSKAGRVLSEKNIEIVKDARSAMAAADKALGALLKAATSESDDGKSAKDEEPRRAKSEEPSLIDPDSALAYIQLGTL
jgi:hypothetical protein